MPLKPSFHRINMARSQGFTLIEVLIAMLVLVVGLLGVAGMQLTSFQNNQNAYFRSQATFLAADMLDRIRANTAGYRNNAGAYVWGDPNNPTVAAPLPADPGCANNAAGCTPAQQVSQDIRDWQAQFPNRLPGANGTITRSDLGDGSSAVVVQVYWNETDWVRNPNSPQVPRGDGIQRSVTLRSVIR